MIRLHCLKGDLEGRTLEFGGQSVLVGRDASCDLSLGDGRCSRRHARLESVGDGLVSVTDLGSTNGIFVNEAAVRSALLRPGDRLRLGKTVFRMCGPVEGHVDSPPEASSEAAGETSDEETPDEETPDEETPDEEMGEPAKAGTSAGAPVVESTISIDELELRLDDLGMLEGPGGHGRPRGGAASDLEDLRASHRRLRLAYRLSQTLAAVAEPEEIYRFATDHVFEFLEGVERVTILVQRDPAEPLRTVSSVHRFGKAEPGELPLSSSVLRQVREEGLGILATDAALDERFSGSPSIVLSEVRALMCVPLITRQRFLGAVYAETFSTSRRFRQQDLELLTLLGNQTALALESAFLQADLRSSIYETMRSLSNALEAKDKYTRGHSDRVALYAVGIGRRLGLDERRLEHLRMAAELHDIGKIAVSDEIIGKQGRLNEEEYAEIQKHPRVGVEILRPIAFLGPVLPFILHHHERYDGTGYPDALSGEAIDLEARVLNLADAFDAMTSTRPYNTPKTIEEALAECEKEAGVSFDADCVRALRDAVESLGLAGSRAVVSPPPAASPENPPGQEQGTPVELRLR